MHLKALTATLAVAVLAGGLISTASAKALSQTTSTNSKSAVAIASQTSEPVNTTPAVTSVTVTPDETLSSIATQYNTTYVRLFDDNTQIQNPDLIFVGELINIPSATQQLPDRYGQYLSAQAASQASQVESQSQADTDDTQATPPVAPAVSAPVQPAPQPVAQPVPQPAVSQSSDTSVWTEIAQCESGGDWSIDTGNGFYGGLQFTLSSWEAVGGTGLPSQASEATQIALAERLQAIQGWGAWPVCSAKVGL
ncbi:MAG TPA: transglycosylase family protein [Candidatus Saccharimonadales bacterium]|nr:transglycosylase family protein [Candidatus Saccharimonadales bacterium]